jgi:hypothetical protein
MGIGMSKNGDVRNVSEKNYRVVVYVLMLVSALLLFHP